MAEDIDGALSELADKETRRAILDTLPEKFTYPSQADIELLRHSFVQAISLDIGAQKEHASAKAFCDEWFRRLEFKELLSVSSLEKYLNLALLYGSRYHEYEEESQLEERLDLIQRHIEIWIDVITRNANISTPTKPEDIDKLMAFIERFNIIRPLSQIEYYRQVIPEMREKLILEKTMEFRDAGKRGVTIKHYSDEDVRTVAVQILADVETYNVDLNVESWTLETEVLIELIQENLAIVEDGAETDKFEDVLAEKKKMLMGDIGYVYRAAHIPQICEAVQAPEGYEDLKGFAEDARKRLESAKLKNLLYRFNTQAAALIVSAQTAQDDYSKIEPQITVLLSLFIEGKRIGQADLIKDGLQTFLDELITKEVSRCAAGATVDNARKTGENLIALGNIAARVKQYLSN